MSNRNRRVGHDLERLTVRDLRDLFPKAKTSREASRLLDNCKVDIANVPLLIQCKAGYEKARPKFDVLKAEALKLLQENFLKDDPIHNLPYVLRHSFKKVDTATIDWNFFKLLLTSYNEVNKEQFIRYK